MPLTLTYVYHDSDSIREGVYHAENHTAQKCSWEVLSDSSSEGVCCLSLLAVDTGRLYCQGSKKQDSPAF